MANWKILDMQHKTSNGYVIETITACEKQDKPGYARKIFVNNFEGTPGPDYIPYEDLTEELVLQWVKEALGSETVLKTEADVDAQAAAQKETIENPTIKDGAPWE